MSVGIVAKVELHPSVYLIIEAGDIYTYNIFVVVKLTYVFQDLVRGLIV